MLDQLLSAVVSPFSLPVSFFPLTSCASSTSITWDPTAGLPKNIRHRLRRAKACDGQNLRCIGA